MLHDSQILVALDSIMGSAYDESPQSCPPSERKIFHVFLFSSATFHFQAEQGELDGRAESIQRP